MSKSLEEESFTEPGTDPQTNGEHSPASWQESYNLRYGTKGTWLTLADIGDMMDAEKARRESEKRRKRK